MDIRQLKRFVTVAEVRSFNKAAEILCVSQPSLTRSIQLLEQSLDTMLFDRGPRGIFLTPMGEDLLPHAKAILNERERAMASLNILRGQQGESLSLGTDSAFACQRLPKALSKMAELYPRLQTRVSEGPLPAILSRLREGKVDMAFGARAPYIDLTDLTFEPLVQEGAAIVARAQHPMLRDASPSREDLASARWIVSDDPMIAEGWTQLFTKWKIPVPAVSIHASSSQFVRHCLLNGDFVTVCDYATCAAEIQAGTLVAINLDDTIYRRPAGLFRRNGSKLTRTASAFVETLREICAAEDSAA